MRGIGGIFFDDLAGDPEDIFAFAKECGEAFLPGYVPIIQKRLSMPFTEREKRWQGIRRVLFFTIITRQCKLMYNNTG